MTMEFKEDTWFHTIWFVGGQSPVSKQETDFLAAIYKPKDGPWEGKYRFRYSVSPDPWDDQDLKHWYTVATPDLSESVPPQLVKTFVTIARMCQDRFKGELHTLLIRDYGEAAVKMLAQESWAHLKSTPKDPPNA